MNKRSGNSLGLTAAICTYNRYEYLGDAIESLLKQSAAAGSYEILVLDNTPACADRADWAKQYAGHAVVRYLTLDTPGLANARNVAVAEARSQIIAFLDDDAVADRQWVEGYIDGFADGGPEVQIAGGPVRPLFEAPRPGWLHDKLLNYFTVIDWGRTQRLLAENEWAAGANIAFRRDAYLAAGGCNVALGRIGSGASLLSNEETELTDRIHASGGKTLYIPRASVDHLIPKSRMTREWLRRRIIWQAISDKLANKPDYGTPAEIEKSLLDYVAAVPAEFRSLRGFFFDTDDPNLFFWQIQSLYSFYALTTGQGKLFEEAE